KMQKGAEKYGATTEYAEVLSVDFCQAVKIIKTTNGEFKAKTVVIASGAEPRTLGLNREAEFIGRGIHYCAHCDGRFYKDKTVIVVGGGNSAASDALYLSRLVKKVYLIHRRDTLRAAKIHHEPLKNAENIEFLWNSTVSEIIADQRVSGVKIKNVQTESITELDCDAVFVSIGRKPTTKFLNGAVNLDENGYIIADESTKTNVDGVYAAGDVRTKALRQIVTAVNDGATAVHFAEEYLNKT
ncbi:MAG: FAD-dependent oxidoreductase, partial [Clostridia bacterium]|nr:FAD-dependent oxidoreductase [Clostridia bacterium]